MRIHTANALKRALKDGGLGFGDEQRAIKRYWADKCFYVSPLIEMHARYEFTFSSPLAESMFVQIDEFQQQQKFFQARLSGDLQPLTARTLRHAMPCCATPS